MPAVNGHVVGSPALQASMSMLSFEPAASTDSLLASIAIAGSFCLFCENGLGGLPMETSRSPVAAMALGTASTSAAAITPTGQSFLVIRLPFRSKVLAPDIYADPGRDANPYVRDRRPRLLETGLEEHADRRLRCAFADQLARELHVDFDMGRCHECARRRIAALDQADVPVRQDRLGLPRREMLELRRSHRILPLRRHSRRSSSGEVRRSLEPGT